jgi:hypothetical protein
MKSWMWIIVAVVVVAAIAGAGSSSEDSSDEPEKTQSASEETRPEDDPREQKSMDARTRKYLNQINTCQIAVGLVILDIRRGNLNPVSLADSTTSARDICDQIRSSLATMDTDHFDEEAPTGWYAVDRYKSGLNAVLAYIDNPRPTKIVEARNKFGEAEVSAKRASRQINKRRRVYDLKTYKP